MADFIPIRDDMGVINSIIKNRQSTAVSETKQPSESGSTDSARGTLYPTPVKRRHNRRNKSDRRKNNRRQTRQNILLETRSNRERRKGDRRNQNKQENENIALDRGIDLLA